MGRGEYLFISPKVVEQPLIQAPVEEMFTPIPPKQSPAKVVKKKKHIFVKPAKQCK